MPNNYCDHCDHSFTNTRCPRCGGPPSSRVVSGVDEIMDSMVEQHSRPSLATLVRAGLKQGLITVLPEYVSGRKRS